MHRLHITGVSLLLIATLSACEKPDSSPDAQSNTAAASAASPWDTLDALTPDNRPYGLDVYTAKCLSCHGDLGQGTDGNPPLKGLSPTAMQQKLMAYRGGTLQGKGAAAKSGLTDAEIAAVSIYAGE